MIDSNDLKSMSQKDLEILAMPSGFATVAMKRNLYDWQAGAMDALNPPYEELPARVALCTPNESGKTSEVIADLIIWHMSAFAGSQTVTTSGTNRQIRHQLYPQLQLRIKDLPGWKLKCSNEYYVEAPNGSRCISFSTDDPGMAEGFHPIDMRSAEFSFKPPEDWESPEGWKYDPQKDLSLMVIVDEAKTVKNEIFEAIERCHPTRYLIASTPDHTNPSGAFYDCFHNEKWRYKTFSVSYQDCPHLLHSPIKVKEREDQIRKWGENSNFVRSMIFGEFPTHGDAMVFNMKKVDHAMSGLVPNIGQGMRRAAFDPSSGGDECPLAIRDGNRSFFANIWRETDATVLADNLIREFKKWQLQPEWISADNGGLGDPICDILESRGWPVNRIDFAGKPKNQVQYANVRAEMYFELSHRIISDEIALPKDELLRDQMSWHTYRENDKELLRLDSKKKMPMSPDRADAIVMLYYDMPGMDSFEEREDYNRRRLSPTMHVDNHKDIAYVDVDGGLLF